MTYHLVTFVIGWLAGGLSCLWWVWRLRNLLSNRLDARRKLLETQRDLENRRVAYDSGRTTLARRDGGTPARISDGMAERPGVLSRYLRTR